MLTINIPEIEFFDTTKEEFYYIKSQILKLEHSLVSVSKWEAEHEKPFLAHDKMSEADMIDYIRCMTITQNVDPLVYVGLTDDIIQQVAEYINKPMTATWFRSDNCKSSNKASEIVTSEVIYYWMTIFNIPMACQKWHLNRLLTLIKVCDEKSKPQKNMPKREQRERYRAINEARKKQLNTRG